jgi:hypothetical protein
MSDVDTADDMTGGSDRSRSRRSIRKEDSAREDLRTNEDDDGDTTSISEMSEFEETNKPDGDKGSRDRDNKVKDNVLDKDKNRDKVIMVKEVSVVGVQSGMQAFSKDDSALDSRSRELMLDVGDLQAGRVKDLVKEFSALSNGKASIGHSAMPRMLLNDARFFQSCDDLSSARDQMKLRMATSSKELSNSASVGELISKELANKKNKEPSPRRFGSSIRRINNSSATAISQALSSAAVNSSSQQDSSSPDMLSLPLGSRKRKAKRVSSKKRLASGLTPRSDNNSRLSSPSPTAGPQLAASVSSSSAEPLTSSAERMIQRAYSEIYQVRSSPPFPFR